MRTIPISIILFCLHHLGRAELGYSDPCSTEPGAEPCNFTKGLVCNNEDNDSSEGTPMCRCTDESQMEYSEVEDTCLVFVNGKRAWDNPLYSEDNDKDHAPVVILPCLDPHVLDYEEVKDLDGEDYAEYAEHCKCAAYFRPLEKGSIISPVNRCLPAWGKCNSTLPCHPGTGMECFRGSCRCPNPIKQQDDYDPTLNEFKCLGIPEFVDGCEDTPDCIVNSYCGEDRKCHCDPGHILQLTEYDYFECLAEYQKECGMDWKKGDAECNEAGGLECFEGKCLCKYEPDLIYDEILHRCTAPEGFLCGFKYGYYGTSDDIDIDYQDEEEKGRRFEIRCSSGLECRREQNKNVGICIRLK